MSAVQENPYGGYVDPNFPPPGGPNSARIIIYGYRPSVALAVLAVVLFAIALAVHVYLLVRRRTWYFTTVTVGLAMEIIGYIFRLLSSQQNPYSIPWFVAQYFCIVVAPVLFSAAIYAIASVLINTYGREHAPMPPWLVLALFITCDVVATVVQVAGAALVGTAYSNAKNPTTFNNILLAGLAFQVFSFAVFLAVLTSILIKSRNSTRSVNKGFLAALIVATLAVYLRTCFRLAETAEGLMETLSTHEVFFGCLEFLPIVVAVFAFTYWHPGRWLDNSIKPARRSKKEAKSSSNT